MKFKKKYYSAQVDEKDCGVASLAMVLRYYGSDYSLASLRELAQTTDQGTTAFGLVQVAEDLGFETRSIQADMSLFDLKDLPYPFIVHVLKKDRFPHYYVVLGFGKDKIRIADPDPAVGITQLSLSVFEQEWTGTALFLAPTPAYQPVREEKKGLWAFLPLLLKQKALIVHILLATLLVTLINIIGSYYLQSVIDSYVPEQLKTSLGMLSLGLMVVYILQQVLTYAQEYLLLVLGQRLSIDVILAYIRHILHLPMSFFTTRRTGEIVSRFTDANAIIDALSSTILSLFLDLSIVLVISVVLFSQSISLFLLTLLIVPIYAVLMLAFMRPFEKLNQASMEANSRISSSIIEDINGIETIKSLTSEKQRYQKLDKEFVHYLKTTFSQHRAEHVQRVLKKTAQLLLNVIILWFGSNLVMEGKMTLGQLMTYNTLLIYFTLPLENIINLQTKLQAAKVANHRLNEVYQVSSEFEEKRVIQDRHLLLGDLVLEDVSYRYGFGRDIVQSIHLTIQAGSKVSLVGLSGSGKTTLAKLMVSFFEPNSGQIRLGSSEIRQVDKTVLRQYIHYLPQQSYIFNGTVLENLRLGAREGVSQEEIFKAVEMVALREEIEQLPLGYQTELTTEGTALSGGQKQRLALARALLTDASILILDEATSSLDILTEKKIIDQLMQLDKTVIFIAHRLTIAERSEQVVVLHQGRIVEQGEHTELLAQQGFYYHLVNS